MAQTPAPNHLTIQIDFDLSTEGSTVRYAQLEAAYEAAGKAVIPAARDVLSEGSIKGITSQIDWSYEWQRRKNPR
jgi:hypothetical protein